MNVLLDTNILSRMAQPGHVQHQAAVDATAALRFAGRRSVSGPPNLL